MHAMMPHRPETQSALSAGLASSTQHHEQVALQVLHDGFPTASLQLQVRPGSMIVLHECCIFYL